MSLISIALRYWHTLSHLKPAQFYGRLWFRLYRPRVNSTVLSSPPRLARGNWQPPAARAASMLGPWQFRFLNREHSLPAQGGWNDAALDKLWLYNLHYFDDLNARNADQRSAWHQALLQRWLQENPPVSGNGWEPYPTSLRIVNWVKWLAAGNAAPPGMTQSLATQARWLSKRLEWHLLGNHLFANAKALVFAGLFFEGNEAEAWLAKGLKIIERELPEQVLADGANFERSPMYHAIFLEDVLDLFFRINAGSYSFEAANPRHEHEWRVPQTIKIPEGKILIPGIVTHSNAMVEHPEVVADRIERWAKSAGRENILVGNDCGFQSTAGNMEIPMTVAWAKLVALGEGAKIASKRLWG